MCRYLLQGNLKSALYRGPDAVDIGPGAEGIDVLEGIGEMGLCQIGSTLITEEQPQVVQGPEAGWVALQARFVFLDCFCWTIQFSARLCLKARFLADFQNMSGRVLNYDF